MPVNRKEVNKIKKTYPGFWAKKDGYYNFIHETRETQRHHYYSFLKEFVRAMAYGAQQKAVIVKTKNRYSNSKFTDAIVELEDSFYQRDDVIYIQ